MEINEVLTPAVSAAGGGVTVAWIAKLMLRNWLLKHDQMADAVQAMAIQMAKMEVHIASFQKTEEVTRRQDSTLTLVQARLEDLKRDLNGLGGKVRSMGQA